MLRKLPHKDNFIQTQSIDDDNLIPDTKLPPSHITQYPIPKDPNLYIPQFKPIKSSVTNTYTFQLGPIEQITRETYGGSGHSTDDYGRKPDLLSRKSVSGPALSTNLVPPPSKDHNSNTLKSQSTSQLSHSHTINAQPLDLYHSMTLKNQPNQSHNAPYLPPAHTIQSQAPPRPPHFEIHKSVEYQLH